jgi:uncharacterized C2H2 Zn-finger protein
MVDRLVKSLGSLARDRQTLQRQEKRLAQRQAQILRDLSQALQGIGYRLTPTGDGRAKMTSPNGLARVPGRKHIKCPKCDRRFAHRLPLSRHLSASHRGGKRKRAKASARQD